MAKRIVRKKITVEDEEDREETYRIGQLIEKLGRDGLKVSEKSIRYYQDQGILPKPEKVNPKEFAYTETHYYIIKIIKILQDFGQMTLKDIREEIISIPLRAESLFRPTSAPEEYYHSYQKAYLNLYKRHIIDGNGGIMVDNCDEKHDRDGIMESFLKCKGLKEYGDSFDSYLSESIDILSDTDALDAYSLFKIIEKLDEITDDLLPICTTAGRWPVYHIFNGMLLIKVRNKMLREQYQEALDTHIGEVSFPTLPKDFEELGGPVCEVDWKYRNRYWINLHNHLFPDDLIDSQRDIDEEVIEKLGMLWGVWG